MDYSSLFLIFADELRYETTNKKLTIMLGIEEKELVIIGESAEYLYEDYKKTYGEPVLYKDDK